MKTRAFFIFSVVAVFVFTFSMAEFVYDPDGNPLKNGGTYHLSPPGIGGPAIRGAIIEEGHASSSSSCSLAVVASFHAGDWPTKIESPYRVLHITTDLPVWISFDPLPKNPCSKDPKWLVTKEVGFGDPVMVGDAKEFPGAVSGWFYIKPFDSAPYQYQFVFCHEDDKCGHVGLKNDIHGNKRLIVSENQQVETLVFRFIKVNSDITMVL